MIFESQFDIFHSMATEATHGLNDFGPDNYHEPLKVLLADFDKYPVYNDMGAQSLVDQIVGLLVGRLLMYQGLKDAPSALNTPIERPVFIVGMARTGTTVLHKVLTQDPTVQSLPFWLANAPMPRPPRDTWESNPFYQQIKYGLENSPIFNDEMQAIHPVSADQSDECRWAIDQTFWSSSIMLATDTPNYFAWLENANTRYAYEYYKKLLALVANGDKRRWILKDPSHMSGLDALLTVFPDACIVQTHREPVDCMKSIANLAWQARKVREPALTQDVIGKKTLIEWSSALQKMERVRRLHNSSRFMDVHMSETRADIIGTIERIFNYFNLPITEQAHRSWEQQLAKDPSVGHTKKHTPPDFGLTKENVNAALGDYYERYLTVCKNANVTPA